MKRSIFLAIILSLSLISANIVNANFDKNKLINAGLVASGIGCFLYNCYKLKQVNDQIEWEKNPESKNFMINMSHELNKPKFNDALNDEFLASREEEKSSIKKHIFGGILVALAGAYRMYTQKN